jgi:hypothetical protein
MTDEPRCPPNGRLQQGTSHQYIVDRLRREGHDGWVAAIESGRVSAFAVAVELGWAERSPTLLGERANQTKRRRHRLAQERRRLALDAGDGVLAPDKLTPDQRNFLLYGPRDAYDPAFDTEEQVHAAWEKHRELLLADYAIGRRPWAWRAVDRPELPWKGFDRERSTLWRAGALGEAERAELERQWRKDFEAGRDLKWADVPYELVKQWMAERRHQKEEPLNVTTERLNESV